MEYKKGIALNQSFGAVLALILVAILVIIAIFMFVNLKATFVNLNSETRTNETIAVTDAGIKVANSGACNFGLFTVTEMTNRTGGNTIAEGNFTVAADGTITNLTDEFSGSWNISYTNTNGGTACNATNTMIAQFGTYPALVGLVGTIIFLGLVIGVLVASFTFGRREF